MFYFVVAGAYENILTMKFSQFTVVVLKYLLKFIIVLTLKSFAGCLAEVHSDIFSVCMFTSSMGCLAVYTVVINATGVIFFTFLKSFVAIDLFCTFACTFNKPILT